LNLRRNGVQAEKEKHYQEQKSEAVADHGVEIIEQERGPFIMKEL